MKKILLFGLILLLTNTLFAQQLIRQSINVFGNSHTANDILLRQTVGQSSNTVSFNNDLTSLRQGFQQPLTKSTASFVENNCKIEVYPNPYGDYFFINIDGNLDYYYMSIYDVTGKIIDFVKLENKTEHLLNYNHLAPGVYVIKIVNGKTNITQRIIKN